MHQFSQYLNLLNFSFSLVGLLIAMLKGHWKIPMIFLFLSNTILFIQNCTFLILATNQIEQYAFILRVPGPLLYLSGPFLYFFTRSLFYNQKKMNKWDFIHFIPFLINFIDLIPFFLSDTEYKVAVIKGILNNKAFDNNQSKVAVINEVWHTIFRSISWIFYFVLSVKTYLSFKRKIKSTIIEDYNSKFNFVRIFLILKLVGFIVAFIVVFFILLNQYIYFVLELNNLINLVIITLIIFKYPEFLYAGIVHGNINKRREDIVKFAMQQSENLRLLESSNFEINLLVDAENKLRYFNKLAEVAILQLFRKSIHLGGNFFDYFPLTLVPKIEELINKAKNGEKQFFEEKLFSSNANDFSYYEVSIKPHFNEFGQFVAIAIGANNIDQKKKMAFLQEKYTQSLDNLAWKSSHVLRAPVSNMKNIVNVIQSDYTVKSTEEMAQLIGFLSTELERLDKVVIDMVSKARKELEN